MSKNNGIPWDNKLEYISLLEKLLIKILSKNKDIDFKIELLKKLIDN